MNTATSTPKTPRVVTIVGLLLVLIGLTACGASPKADGSRSAAGGNGDGGATYADAAAVDELSGHGDAVVYATGKELLDDASVRVVGTVVSVADGPTVVQHDGDQVYLYRYAVVTVKATDGLGAQSTAKAGSLIAVSLRRGTDIVDEKGQPYYERPVPPTSVEEIAKAIPAGTRAIVLSNPSKALPTDLTLEQGSSDVEWSALVEGTHPQRFSLETSPGEMSGWPKVGFDQLVQQISS